jgi:uncharacterized protein YxjI
MTNNFFESNSYFIDEKVNIFKFENCYNVFNDQGQNIGAVKQKLSVGDKFLRILLNKAMLPFLLEIKNNEDQLVVSISRGWTFFMSKITIKNAQGETIGSIKQKFKLLKPSFRIFNSNEEQIAEINGDWKAWNFKIFNASEEQIGTISKKLGGAMKELFTTADKYNVNIDSNYSNTENKIIILAGAITIDMVLKESK